MPLKTRPTTELATRAREQEREKNFKVRRTQPLGSEVTDPINDQSEEAEEVAG